MKGIVRGFVEAGDVEVFCELMRSEKYWDSDKPVAVVSLDDANIVSRVEVAAQQMYEGFNDKSATSWDAASDACRAYYRRGALLAVRAALEIGEAQHG